MALYNLLKLPRVYELLQANLRCYIATRSYRQITVKEEKDEIIIEGVIVKEEVKNLAHRDVEEDTCPIRSRGIQVTYEDVLILRQFITSTGEIIPRETTGLCLREHIKVSKAIKMSQRANLLPGEEDQRSEQGYVVPKLNRYLTKFQIGSRNPIRKRGPYWNRYYYKVGEQQLLEDAPRISNKPAYTNH